MTELPGLPSFGVEPAFAADDTAYGLLVGRALSRRRRRLAVASATAVFAVTVATASRAPADLAGLEPTGEPTAAASGTHSPGPEPSPTPADPEPSGEAEPGEPADPEPEPEPSEPPAEPAPSRSAGPGPDASTGDRAPVWRETWRYRPDDDTADPRGCAPVEDGTVGWCFRFTGPRRLTSGAPAEFAAELCRAASAPASRVELDNDRELAIWIEGRDLDGDGTIEHTAASFQRLRDKPHSRPVQPGQCVLWTVAWNGVSDQGGALPAGTYSLRLLVLGGTPREYPLPPANGDARNGHGYYTEEYEVR